MSSGKQIRNSIIAGMILSGILLIFKNVRALLFWKIELSVWLFIVILFFALLSLLMIFIKVKSPKWVKYQKDNFDGMVWRWGYSGLSNEISKPYPYCPYDDTILVCSEFADTYFNCETCKARFGPFSGTLASNQARIRRQIDRKIRNGQYSI